MIMNKKEILSLLWDANGKKRIGGWWKDLLFDAYEAIDNYHTKNEIKGNLGEIGIFKGRSLIPLSNFRKEGELVVAADNDLWANMPKMAAGTPAYLENLKNAYGDDLEGFRLFEESSLKTKTFRGFAPYRFFYVDGDHSTRMTLNDLEIGAASLNPEGILFLDDYQNPQLGPEIRKAVDIFIAKHSDFCICFSVGQTLFLTKTTAAEGYRAHLRETFKEWKVTPDEYYGIYGIDNYMHPLGLSGHLEHL